MGIGHRSFEGSQPSGQRRPAPLLDRLGVGCPVRFLSRLLREQPGQPFTEGGDLGHERRGQGSHRWRQVGDRVRQSLYACFKAVEVADESVVLRRQLGKPPIGGGGGVGEGAARLGHLGCEFGHGAGQGFAAQALSISFLH